MCRHHLMLALSFWENQVLNDIVFTLLWCVCVCVWLSLRTIGVPMPFDSTIVFTTFKREWWLLFSFIVKLLIFCWFPLLWLVRSPCARIVVDIDCTFCFNPEIHLLKVSFNLWSDWQPFLLVQRILWTWNDKACRL